VRRAVPLLLVPALLSACGGSGGSTSTEAPRLTQKQFVQRGNQVCIASDRRIFRIGNLSTDPAGWERTARAATAGINEMSKLRPPQARQKTFDAMIAEARKLHDSIEDVHDALVSNNLAKARTAQARATQYDTRIKRLASRLGLTFCEQLLTNWPA
jgi:hypothetical protein